MPTMAFFSRQMTIVALLASAAVSGAAINYAINDRGAFIWTSALPAAVRPDCRIKGNVSRDTRERIYHVPGQAHYFDTRINLFKGERWFCSEADARAAGWRKAKV